MEHSPPIPHKRKASQSSPVQDHRCIPQEDPPALLHDAPPTPSVDDDPSTHRPKRPRLSLNSPAPLNRARRSPPPRKRGSPRPVTHPPPQTQDVYPTLHGQQYSLHRGPFVPATSGSLLSPLESPAATSPLATVTPQFYVPPNLPVITRETLRELDLESILKNPQLRHDLMFDPGLQFRPTTSRRKQLITDRYWTAVTRELEYNCTCTAWSVSHTMLHCRCGSSDVYSRSPELELMTSTQLNSNGPKRKRPPTPPPWSDRYYTAYLKAANSELDPPPAASEVKKETERNPSSFQINIASRIGPMLHELVAVLKSVIVPPPLTSPPATAGAGPAPSRIMPPHSSQSSSDVQHLLSHFDPQLIERELRCGLFDPSGLFGLVGETLKRHCAPMRDQQVDKMMSTARSSEGTRTDRSISTMRMCFEILELMKLDIANHQLQHLRPFLAASTPDFEMRIFIERTRRNLTSVRITRGWLQNAWEKINQRYASPAVVPDQTKNDASDVTISSTMPPACSLSRRIMMHLSLTEAITNLVFDPLPHPNSSGTSTAYIFPETLYLDTARVTLLVADAADLTALYMLLMLWRQLVFWNPANGDELSKRQSADVLPPYRRTVPKLEDWEVDRVKREIWEIGPRRVGSCFLVSANTNSTGDASEERAKWNHAMQNVALQIATRAEEARTCTSPGRAPTTPSSAATRKPPSQPALDLMSGWIQSHMRRDSALAARFRELLRQEVADVVTQLTWCGCNGESVPGSDGVKHAAAAAASGGGGSAFIPGSGGGTAGLEPLMPEIRHLAQRLAKLVLVNMRVYWGLYDGRGFLVEKAPVET